MNAKHITDITIENFRGFGKLELHGLGAVNLIVGQNNTGKTSLLEAITLIASPNRVQEMPGILRANSGNENKRYFRWLLRDAEDIESGSISASSANWENSLQFSRTILPHSSNTRNLHHSKSLNVTSTGEAKNLQVRIVSVQHRSPDSLVKSFGNAVRKRQGEELVHSILRAVDPRILRVRVDPAEEGNIVSVDIGLSESLPLSQVGQGIYRLVAMLSDLIGETPQVCIIDELENGIHYVALKEVWKGIAEISSTLGIQVFATTHSRECLEAAHEVFFNDDLEDKKDFAVIQLMRVKGQVVGKVLNEDRVDAAMQNEIELR